MGSLVLALALALMPPTAAGAAPRPGKSGTLALTSNGRILVTANRENHSATILLVRDLFGRDTGVLIAEVPVGYEPRGVCLTPDDRTAFVTNAVSGTVSVIDIGQARAVAEIPVGPEPRGCVAAPNGTRVYVANHTAGTVSVIDPAGRFVTDTVAVGGHPAAIAITNNGNADDSDERVFVTHFFAERIPNGPGEVSDLGKRGVVVSFPAGAPRAVSRTTLSPLRTTGFTADRSAFCRSINPNAVNNRFCPAPDVSDPNAPAIVADPQGAFPNQLASILIRGSRAYLPNIGAAPAPPAHFQTNVQGLVHVIDTAAREEIASLHVNLNDQIRKEPLPAGQRESLVRLFLNDLVDIDADAAGKDFLLVSRGGNYVMRAKTDSRGALDIGAPDVRRFRTGSLPNGVVVSDDGSRAYVYNELNVSVTAIDLENGAVLSRDIAAGAVPPPGGLAHGVRVGKLAFFTALGLPDNGVFAMPIRSINPLEHRNKASNTGWSSCASCHPDGLADGVTWSLASGPRQTPPLSAFFSKRNARDQRVGNWSAISGSITDFNATARGIENGLGFAGNPPNPNVYNHGITQGASDALDAMTLWVETVRPLHQPIPDDQAASSRGRAVFGTHCASCHGGAKWTKSQVLWRDNPAFDADPARGGRPIDPGLTVAGAQIVSFKTGDAVLKILENVGTFDPLDPTEIRGGGAMGTEALGAAGFNVPSLLGIGYHAPYLHHGAAETLEDLFRLHALCGSGRPIEAVLDAQDRADLLVFLKSIDARTATFLSEANTFRDTVAR